MVGNVVDNVPSLEFSKNIKSVFLKWITDIPSKSITSISEIN